jgi:hypothetical protein
MTGSGAKGVIPVSANFQSYIQGSMDTLTLNSVTFNGNVATSGTLSLTQGTGGFVDATLTNVGFTSATSTVTVGMTFTLSGPDTLNSIVGTSALSNATVGAVTLTGSLTKYTINEVVTIGEDGSLFSLTNLFEINPAYTGSQPHTPIMSKTGGAQFEMSGTPLFNPNGMFTPQPAETVTPKNSMVPEPSSLPLFGLALAGGISLAVVRRRQRQPLAISK